MDSLKHKFPYHSGIFPLNKFLILCPEDSRIDFNSIEISVLAGEIEIEAQLLPKRYATGGERGNFKF